MKTNDTHKQERKSLHSSGQKLPPGVSDASDPFRTDQGRRLVASVLLWDTRKQRPDQVVTLKNGEIVRLRAHPLIEASNRDDQLVHGIIKMRDYVLLLNFLVAAEDYSKPDKLSTGALCLESHAWSARTVLHSIATAWKLYRHGGSYRDRALVVHTLHQLAEYVAACQIIIEEEMMHDFKVLNDCLLADVKKIERQVFFDVLKPSQPLVLEKSNRLSRLYGREYFDLLKNTPLQVVPTAFHAIDEVPHFFPDLENLKRFTDDMVTDVNYRSAIGDVVADLWKEWLALFSGTILPLPPGVATEGRLHKEYPDTDSPLPPPPGSEEVKG